MVPKDTSSTFFDSATQSTKNRDPQKYSAARIAGMYLIAGVIWIGLSDFVLSESGGFTATGFLVSIGKGLGFVLSSTILVYLLCRREYRNSSQTMGLLRAIVDGTTDAVFVKDINGRYLLINEAGVRFSGRPISEVLGRDDRELFASLEAEQLMANDRKIMASGKVTTQDETLTSSGATRTYIATKAPYFDSKGQVIGIIGISRNITSRALVESTLRETEMRLRQAQKIAKLGSWSWNPLTDEVWWSDTEFELFGVAPQSIQPTFQDFLSFLHPDDRQIAISRVEAMRAGSEEFADDMRILRADGTCIWIHSQARASRDVNGQLVRVEGTDQDISSQRQAREDALANERRLQAAVEVVGLGVIDIDYDQQTAKLSTFAAQQFGLSPRTVVTRQELHACFHPADREELSRLMQGALSPGGAGWFAMEHRVTRSDGTTRWLNVRKQVTFVDGLPQGAIVVTADVTEQRQAQSRFKEQEMLVREAAELAKVGGWGFDPVTLQSDWTPAVAQMYGLAPDTTPALVNALDFFSPEQRPELEKALAAATNEGVPHDMELQLTAINGEKKWVRTICRPIIENGRVVRVRGSLQDISDLKRAETDLRASEERYRMLFESNPHPMWVFEVDTLKFQAVNDAAIQAYGYTREEFLAMTIRDIRPADEIVRLELEVARKGQGLRRAAQWKHRRKDGTVFDVEISSHNLPGAQGHLRLVLALNITDRKRAEEAREVATQRLIKFASQLPGAIFLYHLGSDNTCCVPYASDKIEAILGIQQELLKSRQIDAFANVHVEDYDSVVKSFRDSAQSLTQISSEFRVVGDDGNVRWISCDAAPERELDGSTVWHGYLKEVTETRKAAIELEEAKVKLEEAQALARIGSWSYDVSSNTHQWSKQMFRIFGAEDSMLTPNYEKMLGSFHPQDADRLDDAVKTATLLGTPYSLVVRIRQPQSEVRYVRWEGRARRDLAGTIVGLYGTAANVTAEVEREEALKVARNQADAANRAKSEFLANMSHEIRTPLTAILGFADLLRGDEIFSAPPHWIHDLDTISSAGKHLLSIINDILDLSKIEADKTSLELIETPLLEVIMDVERILRSVATGKGVSLNAMLSTPVPDRILCDPTRLRQILMNLVGNAVKFTEAGSITIKAGVEVTNSNAFLVIDIEDTGRGIDAEQSQLLFNAFEQADNTVSRKHGGTGLGLTISRRLAILMGGDVRLVRTELGKGSCFRLQLPLVPVVGSVQLNSIQPSPVAAVETKPQGVVLHGRILLAEDGPDNQRLIGFLLRKGGATVDVADHGKVALEMIEKAIEMNMPYDLLVTDIQMPVMDGYELAKTLRTRGSKMPIVALTAHALAEDRSKCLEAGCNDYLSKPVDKHSLMSICAKWLASLSSGLQ